MGKPFYFLFFKKILLFLTCDRFLSFASPIIAPLLVVRRGHKLEGEGALLHRRWSMMVAARKREESWFCSVDSGRSDLAAGFLVSASRKCAARLVWWSSRRSLSDSKLYPWVRDCTYGFFLLSRQFLCWMRCKVASFGAWEGKSRWGYGPIW